MVGEREQGVAQQAHVIGYRVFRGVLLLIWAAALSQLGRRNLFAWVPLSFLQLVYLLAWLGVMFYYILPQTIVLWMEPEMGQEEC